MVNIRQEIQRISSMKANVLITGERGSGKQLIARAIHFLSPRSKGPLARMSCGDLSLEHLEGEVRVVHLAKRGTLFMDEVDALSPSLQERLLQIFKKTPISGFGNTSKKKLDVRLLAASNSDLIEMVELGGFGKQLCNHLKTLHIRVSPLRERKEDIPLLLHKFLHEYCLKLGGKVLDVPGDVADFFSAYHWPGNVTELENVVQRAIVLGGWSFIFDEQKLASPNYQARLAPSRGNSKGSI